MATEVNTTYTYICDLCGLEIDKKTVLTTLFYKMPASFSTNHMSSYYSADICMKCQLLPISNVVNYFIDKMRKDYNMELENLPAWP